MRLICILFIVSSLFGQDYITKEDYLNHIKTAAETAWQNYQQALQKWQQSDNNLRNDTPPRPGLYPARRDALLYNVTGEQKYAERAKAILLAAENGHAYYSLWILDQIRDAGVLTAAELDTIETKTFEHARRALDYWVEWGTMNHCSNHIVNALTNVMQHYPDHPDYKKWRQKRDINLSANWGLWSIEDSHIYIPVWLKPLIQHAELAGSEAEFFSLPTTKYYFDYLVQLVTPDGQIAEFGDGKWGKGYTWEWSLSLLEKGASVYKDGKMKWAAHRLFQRHVNEIGLTATPELVEAYLWANDAIREETPQDPSRLVLEDYVGKKVVLRSGWDVNASYLFLNFLDDPPFGIDGKEHLINTINVEAEKNHHGHADENAINCLMKNGAVLLHDSGYRETSSTGPDGQYRADHFHNKLVARKGLADPDWRLMPFLLDGGRYKFVNTKLMHFRRYEDVDISRTRLVDKHLNYQWDRLITFFKPKEWFILFDIVKVLKRDAYTFANLFYTDVIAESDTEHQAWYDTYYRTIVGRPIYPPQGAMDPDTRLLIYFPQAQLFRQGAEQLRRAYQRETCIYSALSDTLEQDTVLVFPTLLIPHESDIAAQSIVNELQQMKLFRDQNGMAIQLPYEDGFVQFNAMLDLEAEYLEANIRPRYTFESGRNQYGDFITDARYGYLKKTKSNMHYAFFKAGKLIYNNQLLFEAPSMLFGQDNGIYRRPGVAKWVAWEDVVPLE